MTNNLCKKCGKEIDNESNFFNGFCEKCYYKWMNKKENRPIKQQKLNKKENCISYIAMLLGIISFFSSIIILSILFFIIIPMAPILIMDVISLFSFNLTSQFLNKFGSFVIMIRITVGVSILSFIFNLFLTKKVKNEITKIGFILSSISIIIWLFLILQIIL